MIKKQINTIIDIPSPNLPVSSGGVYCDARALLCDSLRRIGGAGLRSVLGSGSLRPKREALTALMKPLKSRKVE